MGYSITMSEGLSQREKRALMRRRRLEANADKRIDSIFTGSGLSAPPRSNEAPESPATLISPPITPPRRTSPRADQEKAAPDTDTIPTETVKPIPEPITPNSPSPATKRKASERPARTDNQYYKEAQASI